MLDKSNSMYPHDMPIPIKNRYLHQSAKITTRKPVERLAQSRRQVTMSIMLTKLTFSLIVTLIGQSHLKI